MAASLASSMAQNVYSLNVVGYVNVTLPPSQFTAVANPLDATLGGTVAGANDITNLFSIATAPTLAASSTISTFNSALNNYDSPNITYSGKTKAWSTGLAMPPGKAVLFYNNGAVDTVVTFTGQVEQGTYNVATLNSSTFSLLGSPVPIGGDLTNSTTVVGLAPAASDSVSTFNSALNNWNNAVTWSAKTKAWSGPMPVAPGQGFLYYNNAATANNWVSNFTVQ
jgi:hypothetical protein